MEDPGNLTPRTAIAEYYRSVTPRSAQSDRRVLRSYSHEDLAQRPRSNPRTRTPLRNPSPLMIGTSLETTPSIGILDTHSDEDVSLTSGTLSSQQQGHSIQQRRQHHPTRRIVFGAAMPSGTSTHRPFDGRRNHAIELESNNNETVIPWQGKSRKSAPSHRKIRRWDNDRFQLSDFSYDFNLRTFHHPESSKKEYLMPNAPSSSKIGVFSTLDQIQPEIREKIVRGDICNSHTRDSVKCSKQSLKVGMDQISPRLFSFLSRACQSAHVQRVIKMMEQILWSYLKSSSNSYLLQEASTNELVQFLIAKSILVQEPEYIHHENNNNNSTSMKVVRFHFHDKYPTNEIEVSNLTTKANSNKVGSTKNPAFYRLLLHSIVQYHGYQVYTTCQDEYKIMSVMVNDEDKHREPPPSLITAINIDF